MAHFTSSHLSSIQTLMAIADYEVKSPTYTFRIPFQITDSEGVTSTAIAIKHCRISAVRLGRRVIVTDKSKSGIPMSDLENYSGVAEGLATEIASLTDEQKAEIERIKSEKPQRTIRENDGTEKPQTKRSAGTSGTIKGIPATAEGLYLGIMKSVADNKGTVEVDAELTKANKVQTQCAAAYPFEDALKDCTLAKVAMNASTFEVVATFDCDDTQSDLTLTTETDIKTLRRVFLLLFAIKELRGLTAEHEAFMNDKNLAGLGMADVVKIAKREYHNFAGTDKKFWGMLLRGAELGLDKGIECPVFRYMEVADVHEFLYWLKSNFGLTSVVYYADTKGLEVVSELLTIGADLSAVHVAGVSGVMITTFKMIDFYSPEEQPTETGANDTTEEQPEAPQENDAPAAEDAEGNNSTSETEAPVETEEQPKKSRRNSRNNK